jgi:regulator of sigma E protease
MTYLISILVFLVIFSVLILVHEFGHFFAARKFGVKVEEFGMGLPPRLMGLWKDKLGTLYSLNWIPFGGFVRMLGEDSEDPALRHREGSFSSKRVGPRTIIILGGVIMNFLLGYLILVLLFSVGTKPFIVNIDDFKYYRAQGVILAEDRVVITDFSDTSPAQIAGLQKDDFIEAINGQIVTSNQQVVDILSSLSGQSVPLEVKRGEQQLSIEVPVNKDGMIGVAISDAPDIKEVKEIQLSLPEAMVEAGYQTARLSWLTMQMFVQVIFDLFTKFELSAQVSGPVGIAQITHQTTQNGDLMDILKLVALLSISLGAINVLPIPALDGGRFLSIFFELITRRRPNAAWEARIHAFGFLIIIILIVAVTYNDILKLISG